MNWILYDATYKIISTADVIQKVRQHDYLAVKNSIDTRHGIGVTKVSSEELAGILQ